MPWARHLLLVVAVPAAQEAAVDLGVQGLDPAVQHLREAGVVRDLGHLDAASRRSLAVPPVDRIST